MAGLNHTKDVGNENIGWTRGVMDDGVPFEAEMWLMNDELVVSIMMPEMFTDSRSTCDLEEDDFGEESIQRCQESSILKIGMVDRGFVTDIVVVQLYVEYLVNNGIIHFLNKYENGAVHLLTDKEKNNIAGVIITLNSHGEVWAETSLIFQNFPGWKKRMVMYRSCT